MCLGIPAQVIALHERDLATVSVSGVEREISVGLVADEGITVGEWVLVHVGFALAKIDEAEAAATLDQLQRLGEPWEGDWEAFTERVVTGAGEEIPDYTALARATPHSTKQTASRRGVAR